MSGCAIPRTALVAGAVTTVAGFVMMSDAAAIDTPDCGRPVCPPDIHGVMSEIGVALGALVVATGVAFVGGGVVGLAMEHDASPPAVGVQSAPPATTRPAPPPTMRPADHAIADPHGAWHAQRTAQLASQLRVAARAGHCQAAISIARQLAALDRLAARALIDHDEPIARCLPYRM